MGKDKSGQRTKGNLKPSSSGRSAELLGGVTNFVGFGGLTDFGYVPAATQATFDDDLQISAEFRVTLRKMSKKDSTTKMKALQEFEGLCSSEEIGSIKTALPYWPRLYSKLSLDGDRRVRESTQSAHSALTIQIGKNLAPYLRAIMPSWLLAMTDPHTPAAITATKCFQVAFSEEKRPGVMLFSSKEIIDLISDNLFIQSSQTLSDPKNTEKEDQESKYVRVLFCSLRGLSLFLETTSKLNDKKGEILAKIVPFIEQEIFWKFSKNESILVRCAWFDLIKSLFEFDVEVLRTHCEKLSKIVFTSLDTTDASVLPHIWIAFLHLCVGLPECWSTCVNPKSVFNRVFSVLRDGGRGFMHEISPQLLPILSVIPGHVMEDQTAFYVDFFRSISTSLRKDKVLVCRRDVCAIIVALNECLKYMSKQHGTNKDLWDMLIKYQVVDLVRSSFEETPQLSAGHLYQETSKLLFFWASATDSKGVRCNIDKLETFWHLFLPECKRWIAEGQDEKISKLKRFFGVIKDPFSTVAKRTRGVRFNESKTTTKADNQISPTAAAATNTSTITTTTTNPKDIYLDLTSTHISSLIKNCFDTYLEDKKYEIYQLFASLLFSYSSESFYEQMIVKGTKEDPVAAKVLFLEERILPLMDDGEVRAPVETSIEIFLHVYARVTPESQKELLMNLKPSLKMSALKALIEKMTQRIESDNVASLWLQSAPLGDRLVAYLERLCSATLLSDHGNDDDDGDDGRQVRGEATLEEQLLLTQLFSFVFSNGYKTRTVFSLEYQSKMLNYFTSLLIQLGSKKESEDDEEESGLRNTNFLLLLSKLLNHLLDSPIHSQVDGLQEILKHLYHILCYPLKNMTEEVAAEIKSCFLKALEQNLVETMPESADELFTDENSLLVYVLTETKRLVTNNSSTFARTLELSELMESVLVLLYKSSPSLEDCSILLDHSVMKPLLEKLLPTDCEWSELEAQLSTLYVTPSILFGTFICREFPLPLNFKDIPSWDQGFVRVSLFVVKMILALCAPASPLEGSPAESTDIDDGSLSLGQFTPLVVLALHGTCHSCSLVQMNTFLNSDSVSADIKLGSEMLSRCMKDLLARINSGNKKLIVKQMRDRCSLGNSSWCVTLSHALCSWLNVSIDASKLIADLDDAFLGCTETKQILIPYLPVKDSLEVLREETEKLSEFHDDPYSALPSVCLITSVLERLSSFKSQGDKDPLSQEKLEASIHAVFDVLVKWRDTASNIFLFASNLSGVPWEDVSLMVSIIRMLTVIVKGHSLHLLHSHWDVTLCALAAWVQSLNEIKQLPEASSVVVMFATACSKCAGVVAELLFELVGNANLKEEYPPTLVEEWQEFFAPSIFNTLLLKFIRCANVYQTDKSVVLYSLTRNLSQSVGSMKGSVFKEITLPPLFNVVDGESPFKLPDNFQFLLNHLGPLMLSRHPQCQCASYSLLKEALPEVMAAWEKNPLVVDEQEDLPQRPLPHTLIAIVIESGPIVETALMDKEFDCTCEITPYTDTFTYISGYLLAWLLTLSSIPYGEESNQQLYASYIRETNLLFDLLNHLFKLMPMKPNLDKELYKSDATMFNTPLTVSACGKVSSEFISWLACQVYIICLSQLPAAVRNWWTNLDRNTQQIVDKFTMTYVSPILITNEINTINDSNVKFDNMTIKSRPGAREIIAIYTIDEASMELVLRMAPNHPLSTVTLEDHKRVGVSVAQWRNWLFGLNTMLSHRNTPLLNSLEFWKKNVDQKFEGIEECFICYYVLHGTNHQIPKLLCRTCKKKFHSACLYKWFSTSNNSTCPICRSLF